MKDPKVTLKLLFYYLSVFSLILALPGAVVARVIREGHLPTYILVISSLKIIEAAASAVTRSVMILMLTEEVLRQ